MLKTGLICYNPFSSFCFFKIHQLSAAHYNEVHNCDTFSIYNLPAITDHDLKKAVGRLFVKVAYLHLPR